MTLVRKRAKPFDWASVVDYSARYANEAPKTQYELPGITEELHKVTRVGGDSHDQVPVAVVPLRHAMVTARLTVPPGDKTALQAARQPAARTTACRFAPTDRSRSPSCCDQPSGDVCTSGRSVGRDASRGWADSSISAADPGEREEFLAGAGIVAEQTVNGRGHRMAYLGAHAGHRYAGVLSFHHYPNPGVLGRHEGLDVPQAHRQGPGRDPLASGERESRPW
jgi:hypothetical protein